MDTEAPTPTIIQSAQVSNIDGLRHFLETVVSSDEVKRSVVRVEASGLSGEIGIFCSRYIVGGRILKSERISDPERLAKVTGFEAVRQILSLRDGTVSLSEATSDQIALLRASLAIEIFSLLNWSDNSRTGAPPLEIALDGVVEAFAHTMTPMEAALVQPPPLPISLPATLNSGAISAEPPTGPFEGQLEASAWAPEALSAFTSPDAATSISDKVQDRGGAQINFFPPPEFDFSELDQIPTPKDLIAEQPSEKDKGLLRRTQSSISDNERSQVGQLYRERQRSQTTREFLKVPKQPGTAAQFRSKKFEFYVTPTTILKAVGLWGCAVLVFSVATNLYASEQNRQASARGAARLEHGDGLGALLEFDAVVRRTPSAKAYLDRAKSYMLLGEFDNAAADYRKASELNPKESLAYLGQATAIAKRYDFIGALNLLNQSINLEPNNADAYVLRSDVESSLGKYPQAIEDASKALSMTPSPPKDLYESKALAEWKSQKYSDGLADYNKAIDATTRDAQLYLGRGGCLLALGNYDKALQDLNTAIKFDKKLDQAYALRAKVFSAKQQYANALQDLTHNIDSEPSASVYIERAKVYMRAGQDGKAIADLDQAITLEPNRPGVDALRTQAYARVRSQKPIIAGDRAEPAEVVAIKPVQVNAAGKPRISATATAAADPLNSVLTDALRSSPNDTKSRRYLAYSFLRNGNYKAAAEQFQMLGGAGTLGVQDQLSYADTLAHLGNTDEAISLYKSVFDGDPYNRVARSNLIKLYMQQGRSFEAAALRSGMVRASSGKH